nr:copia protein [Tanacetum cinerariifolium]
MKWVLKNKKDKRGIVIRNKARLVAQGHTQEEVIDYEEVFAPNARIEAIKLFLAYASYMSFTVYQMDVKSVFLYGTIDEEVYVMQTPGFQDPEFPHRVYKVEKAMCRLHQAPRAWYGTLSKYLLDNGFQRDIRAAKTPMDRENPWGKDGTGKDVELHLYRYLKGNPKLGLWYPKESPFDLVAYLDSDYGGSNQDRKSTTGGCQFLERRLISWQCKKQTIVATSTTKAEYVAAASGCGQVIWIQNQLLDYGTVELFASMLVSQGEGSEHPSESHHKPSAQDESIPHEQITQSPQHAPITSSEPIPQSHKQTTSKEETIPSQSYYVITTPRRITRGTIRISQSKVPSPEADETAFPSGDVRYGEAFPTDTSLDAVLDRENIAKTSAMPHESLPRVTSLGGGKGSMQQTLQELMDFCTSLQRQHSLLEERVQNQDLKITQLKTRIKTLKDNERRREGLAQEDAPNTGGMDQGEDLLVGDIVKDSDKSVDKGSDSTDEMSHVLGSLGAANILASGEQAERDSKIARIHVERELVVIIAQLDRSNEMIAKYLSGDEQAAVGLSHDEKKDKDFKGMTFEKIKEKFILVWEKMQDFMPMNSKLESKRLKRPGIQLDKERSKKLKTAEASGTEPFQEQQSEDLKELSEEELKKMMVLVPVEELYIEALQSLVKETCSTTEVIDEKEKELWVELKRLYEPNSRDPLWALQ